MCLYANMAEEGSPTTAMPVIKGSIVTSQVTMSPTPEIFLSTGSVSLNINANNRDTMLAAADRYMTISGSAGQLNPLRR